MPLKITSGDGLITVMNSVLDDGGQASRSSRHAGCAPSIKIHGSDTMGMNERPLRWEAKRMSPSVPEAC